MPVISSTSVRICSGKSRWTFDALDHSGVPQRQSIKGGLQMKRLAIVLSVCAAGLTSAHAEVIRCDAATVKDQTYLLVTSMKLGAEKAAIFKNTQGEDLEVLYSDASLLLAQGDRGGPITIHGSDKTEVDWSKEKGCYKFRKAGYSFSLRRGGAGYTGEMRLLPNIAVKKNSNCSVPRPMPPRPLDMKCSILNLN
jgi:hypothetical protein